MIGMLHTLEKPTIAAVNGAAAGLGMDLALCCDFVVASEQAFFTMSYLQRGLIPDGGGLYFLPRRVGQPRAKELVFSARRVMPDEALKIGLAEMDRLRHRSFGRRATHEEAVMQIKGYLRRQVCQHLAWQMGLVRY